MHPGKQGRPPLPRPPSATSAPSCTAAAAHKATTQQPMSSARSLGCSVAMATWCRRCETASWPPSAEAQLAPSPCKWLSRTARAAVSQGSGGTVGCSEQLCVVHYILPSPPLPSPLLVAVAFVSCCFSGQDEWRRTINRLSQDVL